MTTFVSRNGSRLTPYMYYQIERLNADVKRLFGVEVIVSSGIRLAQEQIDIFLQRYVTAGNVRGRHVYDTRVWRGVRYYRISSAGTVAVPSTSNHEIQGTSAAVDLRDTGSDGGLATWGSARSNWLRANAHRYGMVPEGFNFNEAWHYKMLNIYSAVPSGGGGDKPKPKPALPEDDDMVQVIRVNKKHIFTLGWAKIGHNGTTAQADITRKVMSTRDEIHELSEAQTLDLLDGLGIPRSVVDLKNGKVKDAVTGEFKNNWTWDRNQEGNALSRDLLKRLTPVTEE